MTFPPALFSPLRRLRRALSALLVLLTFAGTSAFVRAQPAAAVAENPPADAAPAQDPFESAAPAKPSDGLNIGASQVLALFRGMAGIPMWGLVLCWFLTISYTVERFVSLQSRRVTPKAFTSRFLKQLRERELSPEKVAELTSACRENDTPIARFFRIVLEHRGLPAVEIHTAVVDAADSELFPLRKRLRAIGGLAALAPLLGLFGTVIGMIEAFQALSKRSGGGKTELLASGISLALIATASGLAVAIMASISYYYLQGKVDQRIHDLELLTNEAVNLVKAPARTESVEPKARRLSADAG